MKSVLYTLVVACVTGTLYGFGPSGGAIAVALPYLKATTPMTSAQLSMLVGSCMIGAIVGGFVAGPLADWIGRKKGLLAGAFAFALGVPIVAFSGAVHLVMVAGLALEGFGAGIACTVMPLYLAEVMPPDQRGKSTAIFQLSIVCGLVISGLIGVLLSSFVGAADAPAVSAAAKTRCWEWMFLFEFVPAIILPVMAWTLPESPAWLKRREEKAGEAAAKAKVKVKGEGVGEQPKGQSDSLLRRKYVLPFVIALLILIGNQASGINSVLGYSVTIFQNAGLTGAFPNWADAFFKFMMLVMTVIASVLVDRKGRRFLLEIGTLGIIGSLAAAGVVMLGLKSGAWSAGPVTGWIMVAALTVFVSSFSVGPGVCAWLALTELMPVRIRAVGMSIALLCNQGVSTALQSTFLPLVDKVGLGVLFIAFSAATVVYWATVHFLLPETKGKTLEEIETYFK